MSTESKKLGSMEMGSATDDDFGEKIVISGISGLFPQSHNVKELSDILYNKINPINKKSWSEQYDHPEASPYLGEVPGLNRFDAQFFKVHYRLGNSMDPMNRKILEQSYQAIYDAGVCLDEISGKKISVYVGYSFSESDKFLICSQNSQSGLGITGCSKNMFANRISYMLNIKGPSMNIDEDSCSSMGALERAYRSIKLGECEAAIVAGANACLHPQVSVHDSRIIKISTDGKTKSFDMKAAGCAKSESINVLFLQKAKNALRIYAEVVHVKSEFCSLLREESGPKYGFYRDPEYMADFLSNFYDEAKVSPKAVEYVEAFGSATPEADKVELEVIDKVFCEKNNKQLLVGSVMSNIGYASAASGISAITKVLLGYHLGKLAGNLHCESPRQDVAGLRDGRMRILTDHQTFGRTYTAVNGLSVTGINAHVLLKGHYKLKDIGRYKSKIPYLVAISGRQESAVTKVFQDLKSRCIDPEELGLFHNMYKTSISGHLGRGFIILDTNDNNETVSVTEKTNFFDDAKRPLWFVYSGMGSQWPGMGTQLMRIPVFAAAIERCRKVLEPKGVDIVKIITSLDKTIFDNILNSFVGIAAIQIGLTDVLSDLEIFPDKIIGHSFGESGCAYADGCASTEETILLAYYRGLVSIQTPFIPGSMAAVGAGFRKISEMCPPEIKVACHNGPDSSTICGPAEIMKEFVAQLTVKNIYAKEVPCSNIAYHSQYIAHAGPGLLKYLSELITAPKARSKRWISTSVPMDRWSEPTAKYSSAEYHTNNLLHPVLFEEASRLIPPNAVLVEIAPHGLFQAILKRSLPDTCKHIPLTRREHPDNALFLLEAIGNLYMEGYNPKVQKLYPKVEFPVSTETPMLSHLIEWAHDERWSLPLCIKANRIIAKQCRHIISVHDDDHRYLKGHVIQDKNTYPVAAMLVAVWDTLAMFLGEQKKKLSVQFCNIQLHSQPVIDDNRLLRLSININRGNGLFEILDENISVASGYITKLILDKNKNSQNEVGSEEIMALNSEDIYGILHSRGYDYENEFRSIYDANLSFTEAHILWTNNWVTLIDGMLQILALGHTSDTVSHINHIGSLQIDVKEHSENKIIQTENALLLSAKVSETKHNIKCGGISIENVELYGLPFISRQEIVLKTVKFVPHVTSNIINETSALYILLQIVAENVNGQKINILEVNEYESAGNFQKIRRIISDIPEVKIRFLQIHRAKIGENIHILRNIDLLMTINLADDDSMCQLLQRVVNRNIFVINKANSESSDTQPSPLYRKVCAHSFDSSRVELLKWRTSDEIISTSTVTLFERADIDKLLVPMFEYPSKNRMTIITPYPAFTELKDLIKEKRVKDSREINLIIVKNKLSEKQDLHPIPFTDLTINIYENGTWGGEYYLPVEETIVKSQQMALEITQTGDINSLRWLARTEVSYTGIPVKVDYVGLNYAYIKRLLGVASSGNNAENLIEYDFSGTTDSNVRVMGIVQEESIRSHVQTKPELLWPVPEHWSLEDAATVPLAYCLAFYCLFFKSRLYHGNSILIHGGAGALGQALISIGLAHGCEIFSTVNSNKKKKFLLALFPELKDDHIGNSRDDSFVNMVLSGTNGRGCDIVISCVKQNLRSDSINCCAVFGFIVDTELVMANEDHEDYVFEMYCLFQGIKFTNQQFSSIFEPRNADELKRLHLMMSEGIARGFVRPLSRVVYAAEHAASAVRLQAGSRHLGRVLLNLQEDISSTQITINCSSDGLQLLLTDDECLGVKLAERLMRRGAKKFELHCNSSKSQNLLFKLRSWEKQGIQCAVSYGSTWHEKKDNIINNKTPQNVEGVYFIVTSNNECDVSKCLEHLTLMARSSNWCTKYFALIDARKDVSEIMKLNQPQQQVTIIKLPTFKVVENGHRKEYTSKNDAVDAIERALCSKHSVIVAYSRNKMYHNLMEELASVADMPNPTAMPQDVILKDLGIDISELHVLQTYLRDKCNLFLDQNTIQLLTISKIRALQDRITKQEFNVMESLKTFFSCDEQDELLATTETIFLPTLTTSASKRGDEFDISEMFLCIIPGVEGLHLRFHTLCEQLKLPAMVLQPGFERPHETLQELAQRCAQALLKKAQLKKQFYLLGYESGVLVALEIAAILEEHGLNGTIFCIGGGPEEVKATFEEELAEFDTEQSLQIAVARHMFLLLSRDNYNIKNLEEELKKSSTWKQKVSICVKKLLGNTDHSIQYMHQVIEAAYGRIVQVRKYNSKLVVLRSLIISVRPSTVSNKLNSQSSLQNHSQQQVVEYDLQVHLANVAQDLRCAAIINRHLESDILKDFENKNLCEIYLLNGDSVIEWVQ